MAAMALIGHTALGADAVPAVEVEAAAGKQSAWPTPAAAASALHLSVPM